MRQGREHFCDSPEIASDGGVARRPVIAVGAGALLMAGAGFVLLGPGSGGVAGEPGGASPTQPAGATSVPTSHSRPDTVRLAMTDSGPVMELPPAMDSVLREHVPGFRPWSRESYANRVLRHAEPPENLALFGAADDFNGDGVTDVVLRGHDDNQEHGFVIMSAQDKFAFHRIFATKLRDRYRTGRRTYVKTVAPEDVPARPELNPEKDRPELRGRGILWIYEGASSTLTYWNGEEFVTYTTGD